MPPNFVIRLHMVYDESSISKDRRAFIVSFDSTFVNELGRMIVESRHETYRGLGEQKSARLISQFAREIYVHVCRESGVEYDETRVTYE